MKNGNFLAQIYSTIYISSNLKANIDALQHMWQFDQVFEFVQPD